MTTVVRNGAPGRARLAALGAHVPERVATNREIEGIGARDAAADDLSAACSGFVYALSQAAATVDAGIARNVLVIGSEVLTRVTDPHDRGTCILFADGAGGALVTAGDPDDTTRFLGRAPVGAAPDPSEGFIKMTGPEVFRFATRIMVESTERLLGALGMDVEQVDLFVAHQANSRILDHAVERLGIPSERLFSCIERYGNTSSASVPLALAEARDAGRLHPGDLVFLIAFGGGLTWGSTLVRYEPVGAA